MKKRIFTFIAVLMLSTSFNHSSAAIISVPNSVPGPVVTNEPDPTNIKSAIALFKSMSKKERRALAKEAKREIKLYKAEKKRGEPNTNTLLLVVVAILLPPLAVYLHEGVINSKFWIDLILTLLFYLPGLIYALVVILGNG